jgi:ABC-2 type transport system ATP-binding protein
MRQRLGLATALLPDPEILILDEPANGLDPEGVRWLRELLRELAARGRTILVSSHVLAEVAQTVQTVVILHRGRLVTQQPLAELTADARRVVRVRSPRARELCSAIIAMGGAARMVESDRLEVTDASAEQIGTLAAAHRIPVFEIAGEQPSLEDVFLELTGARPSDEELR